MVTALGISMVCIFLVLLFQFRTISEPLVVMSASAFAVWRGDGTGGDAQSFGSQPSWDALALSGIVVRNSIILVGLHQREAGKAASRTGCARGRERRLRPIS